MKRVIISLVAIIAMAVVFNACQKEDALKGERKVMSVAPACETECFEPGTWSNEVTFTAGVSSAAAITIKVSNNESQVKYVITSNDNIGKITWSGEEKTYSPVLAPGTEVVLYKNIGTNWNACDIINETFSVRKTGSSGVGGGVLTTVNTAYSLIGICCQDLLTADLACGATNTATFKFTATESGPIVIQGGLTAGTSIVSANSNVLTLNPGHSSAGGPSNVTRWEGNVVACEEVTITIVFTGGNGIGDWSAKRGEVVLGATPAQACN
jgi:hypothetical protein